MLHITVGPPYPRSSIGLWFDPGAANQKNNRPYLNKIADPDLP